MIKDPNVAKQVSEVMLDIFARVDASLTEVKKTCSPEEVAAYRKATSHVVDPYSHVRVGAAVSSSPCTQAAQLG